MAVETGSQGAGSPQSCIVLGLLGEQPVLHRVLWGSAELLRVPIAGKQRCLLVWHSSPPWLPQPSSHLGGPWDWRWQQTPCASRGSRCSHLKIGVGLEEEEEVSSQCSPCRTFWLFGVEGRGEDGDQSEDGVTDWEACRCPPLLFSFAAFPLLGQLPWVGSLPPNTPQHSRPTGNHLSHPQWHGLGGPVLARPPMSLSPRRRLVRTADPRCKSAPWAGFQKL